jgi:molybdopterin converting factor small subunit
MITVRLPSSLRASGHGTAVITEPVASIRDLIAVLERHIPGLEGQLDDSVFNFAVNDELLLHRAGERRLTDGDVVEIIPTIAGG